VNNLKMLAVGVRSILLSGQEVGRLGPIRRGTSLFSQGQPAQEAYLIEDGLVKLTRTSDTGTKFISAIYGPGHLIGEEAAGENLPLHYSLAETLTVATVYRVPCETLKRLVSMNPEVCSGFITYLLERSRGLEEKGELLCLYDVEYRILYNLANLAKLVKPVQGEVGYQLPLTQLELADLVGATRETTSTTLNLLERRGLIKLSRRLMTINSPNTLMDAARDRLTHTKVAG
jgi:CRP/FNR family transcriptional regulator